MDYELLFLKSLLLTVSIETVVLYLLCRFAIKPENTTLYRIVATGVLASMATLPYLWFIFPVYIDQRIWYIIISETVAVLAETLIIGVVLRVNLLKSFVCSFSCNAASFLTGVILNWP